MKLLVKYEIEIADEDIDKVYYDGFMDYVKNKDPETIRVIAYDCVHHNCDGGCSEFGKNIKNHSVEIVEE